MRYRRPPIIAAPPAPGSGADLPAPPTVAKLPLVDDRADPPVPAASGGLPGAPTVAGPLVSSVGAGSPAQPAGADPLGSAAGGGLSRALGGAERPGVGASADPPVGHAHLPAGARAPSARRRGTSARARAARVVGVLVVVVMGVVALAVPVGADGGGGAYIPPVDAPVVDPFHLPDTPYGAGNRGLEYATLPGTAVRASAAGVVSFAGPVGGALHVTVLHPDGVRTSYSFLARIAVVLGQPVRQGQVVGVAGARFHFGARVGGDYIDPAALFSGAAFDVALLPLVPAGSGPAQWGPRWFRALACCWWSQVT
jgi:murein DD-endopeptidase MepM/ murein hydrolase activator NlpD